jgi:outer membrane immunogenic protein
MRHFQLAILTAVAVTGFASVASAADMAMKAPPAPAPAPSWTGWYVGINGGGEWGRTDPTLTTPIPSGYFFTPNAVAVETAGSQSYKNSGGLAGAQIGYHSQLNSVVLGVEAGFDWTGIRGTGTTIEPYPAGGCLSVICNFTVTQTAKTDWLITLLARAGVSFGSWYPYVTGGLAVANIKYSVAFTDTDGPGGAPGVGTAGSFSRTQAAPAVGAGLEWKWDNHWSLRGEYLYIPFSGPGGTTPNLTNFVLGGTIPSTAFTVSDHLRENIVRAALSYRF